MQVYYLLDWFHHLYNFEKSEYCGRLPCRGRSTRSAWARPARIRSLYNLGRKTRLRGPGLTTAVFSLPRIRARPKRERVCTLDGRCPTLERKKRYHWKVIIQWMGVRYVWVKRYNCFEDYTKLFLRLMWFVQLLLVIKASFFIRFIFRENGKVI